MSLMRILWYILLFLSVILFLKGFGILRIFGFDPFGLVIDPATAVTSIFSAFLIGYLRELDKNIKDLLQRITKLEVRFNNMEARFNEHLENHRKQSGPIIA